MTDEKKFDGFEPLDGNFTMTPNQVFAFMPNFTEAEFKCLMYIVRHTLGFLEPIKAITVPEFVQGRKKRDGTRMDAGTGLSRPAVQKALASLTEWGYIVREIDDSDKAREVHSYGLKILAPGAKNFSAGGKKSMPRSEKYTKERDSKKEKEHKAAPTGGGSARPRNEIFDAIVKAAKLDANAITKAMAKAIGTASADLKGAGFTAADVPLIYQYCVDSKFKNFGPMALAKHAPAWRASQSDANAAPVRQTTPAPRAPLNRAEIDEWNKTRLEIARKIRIGELPKDTPVPPKPEPVYAAERTE